MKITVTGAAGKAGRVVVEDLLEHGYEVQATDIVGVTGDRSSLPVSLMRADLSDYGQAIEAIAESDAVVHLGNIPAPGHATEPETLHRNTSANANVFMAASRLGLKKVVWASSEMALGLPWDTPTPPHYAPVDEAHYPYPTSAYGLSKVLGETAAEHVSRWSGLPIVGLRISNIHWPEDYAKVPGYWDDVWSRRWNLWGYIDARDVALACRLALEAETTGSHNVIVAAADTVMNVPSADLMAQVFPQVPLTRPLDGFETLLTIDAARELFGYVPEHSWRDHVEGV